MASSAGVAPHLEGSITPGEGLPVFNLPVVQFRGFCELRAKRCRLFLCVSDISSKGNSNSDGMWGSLQVDSSSHKSSSGLLALPVVSLLLKKRDQI